MQNLLNYIKTHSKSLSVVVALDVRAYKPFDDRTSFYSAREAFAKLCSTLQDCKSCFFVRQDHACEITDMKLISPNIMYEAIVGTPPSTRCSCGSCAPTLFDHSKQVLIPGIGVVATDASNLKLIINLTCSTTGDLNTYNTKAASLIQSGVNVACINIGGSSTHSQSCSSGFYYYFASASDFSQHINTLDLSLPEDKPEIRKRRIGSRYIQISINYKYHEDIKQYVIEAMHETKSTEWTVMGTTQNDTFEIKTVSALAIQPTEKYKVRVQAIRKNEMKSKWAEPVSNYPFLTLQEDPMLRNLLKSEKEIKEEIVKLQKLLSLGMIQEGKDLGTDHYKYLAFGDVGAGKSSLWNTIATAFETSGEYFADFTVGKTESQSTTKRLYRSVIADCLVGYDIPGVNGENYHPDKVAALVEGAIPEGVDLDVTGWAKELTPFEPKKVVHIVFFVVPVDSLDNPDVQERYRKLKQHFTSYKDYGIEGYQPYLIITKGDTIDLLYTKEKWRVWDCDDLHDLRKRFCLATSIPENCTFFIVNYQSGREYEKDPVVDYTALYTAYTAIAEAKSHLRRMAKHAKVIPFLIKNSSAPSASPKTAVPNASPKTPSSSQSSKSIRQCKTVGCEGINQEVSGKFCSQCGKEPPVAVPPSNLSCRTTGCVNFGKQVTGKFCGECGKAPVNIRVCKTSGCTDFEKQVTGKFCSSCGQPPS